MTSPSLLQTPKPPYGDQRKRWGQLYGSADALAIAGAAAQHDGLTLVVCKDEQEAWRFEQALPFFAADSDILHFPDLETLPYDMFSPHQDIVSQRLTALYRLPSLQRGILLVSLNTLLQRLPPEQFVASSSFLLKAGDSIDIEDLRKRFQQAGYRVVDQVMEHGEFAVRGGLIDLYPMGSNNPFRIDLFDDEVETIRSFDPETQLSIEKVDEIRLLPAREFPQNQEAINGFRQRYRAAFADSDLNTSAVYRQVSDGSMPGGIEYYLPLFFDELATLFDYLPDNTLTILPSDADNRISGILEGVTERYEQRRHDAERPILAPAQLFIDAEAVADSIASFPRIDIQHEEYIEGGYNFGTRQPPVLPINARADEPAQLLLNHVKGFKGRTLFAAESAGRREALLEMLSEHGLRPQQYSDWQAFCESDTREPGIVVGSIDAGLQTDSLSIITEQQLFGDRVTQRKKRRKAARDPATVIRDLTDLSIGAPVVHEDNGVGRYQGLVTLTVNRQDAEYLLLEYAGGDKLYVPVASLHLISRYTGTAPENAPLHKLGSEVWERAKRRAKEKVRDVAAELLEIHARRAARKGNPMKFSEAEYRAFAAAFPFEETPDQHTAIEQVLNDLHLPQPMDRVVCADVGFGKTEIAMRAAFAAVGAGYQVALLVPTTLLAQQHYSNFKDRFADWPVRVEVLSRFNSGSQQTKTMAALTEGKVDIVIGTHKLIQPSVKFKNLGLVIIDEEHRFGVRHKEQLKALRAEVDLLTLTATPIPRTLNMGLAGMRDLSIVATPPSDRLAVKTFLSEWDNALIREACQREIRRGGQVYFLHNDVQNMEKMQNQLQDLLPDAKIEHAHGQMRESELEQIMLDFHHRRFDILLCSTIVESGIDNPNANTILINRADKFGLAQLHQLRGRVGRSHHRAYAYLLVPEKRALTADAQKRLEAIESLEELGAGFTLATHDLEIRGAGELLGEGQTGQIQEVGFALYNDLLERAVKALKRGDLPSEDTDQHATEVDLHLPALLPEDYVPDVHNRLILYKRLASAADKDELRELEVELVDRFGMLPTPTKNLVATTKLKLLAAEYGVRKVDMSASGGRVEFNSGAKVDPMAVIRLIQAMPENYKLDGQDRIRLIFDLPELEDRINAVQTLFVRLELKKGQAE